MGLYSIELTPADTMDQQSVFQQEMADLLGCRQLTILPPFPDYSLLSQNHSPKALLKIVNEVILSRRPSYENELGWLLLPLVQGEGVVGVLFAEEVDQKYADAENLVLLERLARLCIVAARGVDEGGKPCDCPGRKWWQFDSQAIAW
jgi:hypothetical protein